MYDSTYLGHPTPQMSAERIPKLISKTPSTLTVKMQPLEFAEFYHLYVKDNSDNLVQQQKIV